MKPIPKPGKRGQTEGETHQDSDVRTKDKSESLSLGVLGGSEYNMPFKTDDVLQKTILEKK
jgi:hypothetical protein